MWDKAFEISSEISKLLSDLKSELQEQSLQSDISHLSVILSDLRLALAKARQTQSPREYFSAVSSAYSKAVELNRVLVNLKPVFNQKNTDIENIVNLSQNLIGAISPLLSSTHLNFLKRK